MPFRFPAVLGSDVNPGVIDEGTSARSFSPPPAALGRGTSVGAPHASPVVALARAAGEQVAGQASDKAAKALGGLISGRKHGQEKAAAADPVSAAAAGQAAVVEQLRKELGLPEAEYVVNGLGQVVEFFQTELGESLAVSARPTDEERKKHQWLLDYLKGIDFHSRVTTDSRVHVKGPLASSAVIVELGLGKAVSQHLSPDARDKSFTYYTDPGTSPTSTGTSFDRSTYMLYEVAVPLRALASKASAMSFGRNAEERSKSRGGGGVQYIVSTIKAKVAVKPLYQGKTRALGK